MNLTFNKNSKKTRSLSNNQKFNKSLEISGNPSNLGL